MVLGVLPGCGSSDSVVENRSVAKPAGFSWSSYFMPSGVATMLSDYMRAPRSGEDLYRKMVFLILDSAFSNYMTLKVDVYYYRNGIDGEMGWLSNKEIVYDRDRDIFLIKGARKNSDGSDKPIQYSSKGFSMYYNNTSNEEYNFTNVKVVFK